MADSGSRLDVTKPLFDQTTFIGRVRHFAFITDPRTVFASNQDLANAKCLIELYKKKEEPPGTTTEQIIFAKKLYESSFHPDTGDLQNVAGRMSFQVPGGMLITGAMLQFYRTSTAVIFWQWVNQSFNALVNYTNRNANSQLSTNQLMAAYVSATASALGAALGCKKYLASRASPLLQRYVPFVAVASANCVNIPLMRQSEFIDGVSLVDQNGNKLTESRIAAAKGISQVVFSRIFMALPGMTILPIIFEKLEKQRWMKRIPTLHAPMQVLGAGSFLIFMVPIACGLFPQECSLQTSTLERYEPEAYEKLKKNCSAVDIPEVLYFNKGL